MSHDPTHPIIERALRGLRAWGEDLKPADAKRLLDTWKHVAELSDHEYTAVLGWCGWTRRACRDCGGLVLFVSDGPDPGWWSHDLVPDPAHPAVPEVRRDDPDSTIRLGRVPFADPPKRGRCPHCGARLRKDSDGKRYCPKELVVPGHPAGGER